MAFFFWLQWTFVTVFGFLASLFLVEVGEIPDLNILEIGVGAIIVGIAQALILSPYISRVWWWVLATVVSWGLLSAIGLEAVGWIAPRTEILQIRLTYGALLGQISGMILGLGQWLAIKKKVPKSWHWIFTNSLGWAVGLPLGWSVGGVLRYASSVAPRASLTNLFLAEVVGLGVTWAIVGAITGVGMVSLLGRKLGNSYTKISG